MGSVGHIAMNGYEADQKIMYHPEDKIRVGTYCGRNLKYGDYSNLSLRNGSVRNACEDCFIQYSPEERNADDRRAARAAAQIPEDDLPF